MLTARAKKSEYTKAAITLAVGLVILGVFMVLLGGNWFWMRFAHYSIRFANVKDLNTGRPVKYAGLDIGRIMKIDVDPNDPALIRVDIGVNRDFPIYQGTVARIAQKGLVGDFYVFLELRGKPGPRIDPGGDIPSVATLDVQDLAAKASELLDEIRPKIADIATKVDSLFNEENMQNLRAMLKNAPKLVDDLRAAANDFRKNWDSLTQKGGKAAETLDQTLKRVDKAVDAVQGELTKTLETFRTETKGVGYLVKDLRQGFGYDQEQIESILENLNRTSRDVKDLMRRLRERPWEVIRPPSEAPK